MTVIFTFFISFPSSGPPILQNTLQFSTYTGIRYAKLRKIK